MMAGERDIASPRTLQIFLRPNTPRWLSKLLKIKFDDVPLEDLFVNCWILGRVADTAQGLLTGVPYHAPSPQLGDRPPSAARADMEKFSAVCDALGVDPVTRVTLEDVQSRAAGERIALCLWDVADALRRRGYETVPEFAPAEDFVQLKRSESEGSGLGAAEPLASPPARKLPPIVPLLPLDTSPAIQKQRARAALPLPPADKKPKPKSKKPAPEEGEKEKPAGNGAAADSVDSGAAAPPPEAKPPPAAEVVVVVAPTPPPVPPQGAPASSSSTPAAPPAAAAEPADPSAGSTDILAAILSPEKNKPAHTQVINALIRGEEGEPEAAAPDARSKRSLGLVMEGPGSRDSSGRAPRSRDSSSRGAPRQENPSLVRVMGGKGAGAAGKKERRGGGGWRLPGLLAALGAVAALAVALSSGKRGKKEEGEEQEAQQKPPRRQGGWQPLRHAGRW